MAVVRSRYVQQQRVQQHYVTRSPHVLDHLQRDSVVFFGVVHETRDSGVCVPLSVQVTKIGMPLK